MEYGEDLTPEELEEVRFWDAAHERHDALISSLRGLLEVPMRVGILTEVFTTTAPREAVWHLGQIVRGALSGKNPHIDAMFASANWLLTEQANENFELFQALFMAAHKDGRHDILNLLRNPPPHRALVAGSRLPEVRLPFDRDISLGERRSLASGSDRRVLERLLMDPSELVIGKLLINPNLQAHDLLTVASRRPTRPEILTTIASSTKWLLDHTIREALVRNPYAPTGIALKLLPTLHIREIRQIAASSDLHPTVNAFAQTLVELRAQLDGNV